jgi:Fibronectin type III domain
MQAKRLLAILPPVSSLMIAALLLAGCGNGVDVSAPGSTAAAVGESAATTSDSPVEITGTPASTATVGQPYVFTPALAQGGGVVTFEILGQPAWATFNSTTGVLTGTPAAANVGSSGGITITGTNGSSSSSIGPFVIRVNASASSATGSASLSWTAPTENTNGTPITGLAGYYIYYGTSANALTMTVTVSDATATSYVVGGLTPGTYYFAVVAYNAEGMDSGESNMASKSI